MKPILLKGLPFFVFILLFLVLFRGLFLNPQELPSVYVGRPLPHLTLETLGSTERGFNTDEMRGKPSLLTIWASWCLACKEEQVFLFELKRQGIPIYGINYKDSEVRALDWLSEWGNPFDLIGFDREGQAAIELGVYGAPETFLIDAKGFIQYRHPGVLTEAVWKKEFLPRIQGKG